MKKQLINNERGFTLLELITGMVILSILASTAIPNFVSWKTNSQIRGESQRVHMNLMSARMTAIKNNNNVVVTFFPATNSYSILNDTNNNGALDAGESSKSFVLDDQVQFGFHGSSIQDMDNNTVSEFVAMGPSDIITFNNRGQADLSGVLFLIHETDFPVNNDRLRGINVIQATGAAELWKYNEGLTPVPWE